MNQLPRAAQISTSVLRCSAVFLLVAMIAAEKATNTVSAQANNNASGKRQHAATLRSSDSPEGSRVVLSSDQSLNEYEAYRRRDRFYVKIPAADIAHAEPLRGRAFVDVKVQRGGDSTIVSFRLETGATGRVEQHSNQLDVVFTLPGVRPIAPANSARNIPILTPNKNANTNQRNASTTTANKTVVNRPYTLPTLATQTAVDKRNASPASGYKTNNNESKTSAALANTTAANRSNPSPASASNARGERSDSSTAFKPSQATLSASNTDDMKSPSAALALNSESKPIATPFPSPLPSPARAQSPTPAPIPSSVVAQSTVNPTTSGTTNQSRQNRWGQLKERVNYWILLAQLNPIPVAIGVAALLLLAGLFLVQRRRTKSPGQVRANNASIKTATNDAAPSVQPTSESKPITVITPAMVEAALATPAMAAAAAQGAHSQPVKSEGASKTGPVPQNRAEPPDPSGEPRREPGKQVARQTKNLLAGGSYDESVIGSNDRETRQLVSAELLAAIVGRNAARRDYALAAFMKHGYFDDATRDLRIADSPNERAAAARRLSFVRNHEATPHLIGALDDSSADVRRAAVEALMDLRDPAAIGPLNSLMKTENDRKVPRTLIKHAIDACATVASAETPPAVASDSPRATTRKPTSQPIETEREVIEL